MDEGYGGIFSEAMVSSTYNMENKNGIVSAQKIEMMAEVQENIYDGKGFGLDTMSAVKLLIWYNSLRYYGDVCRGI